MSSLTSNVSTRLHSLPPSGGSIYNLYPDDDEDAEASPSGQQIIENSITMNKMKLLRAKMESMNLSKKVKLCPLPLCPLPSHLCLRIPAPSKEWAARLSRLALRFPHCSVKGSDCLVGCRKSETHKRR